MSARSVVASTLLGLSVPRLPARLLVRSGELFGIPEGTTRTALSRMVGAGELVAEDGNYALAGHLSERHARQEASRHPRLLAWRDRWLVAVVTGDARTASDRSALRGAMREMRLAEVREGVWTRPDNLGPLRHPAVDAQCVWLDGRWQAGAGVASGADRAAALWDLDGWATSAALLLEDLAASEPAVLAGDLGRVAPSFVLLAAVLRHLQADPLLPAALLPAEWPGDALRAAYDGYQAAYARLWRDWFRQQTGAAGRVPSEEESGR